MATDSGLIVRALSGFYYVLTGDGLLECRARGRFRKEGVSPLVGDTALVTRLSPGQGVVDGLAPRKNRFIRPACANVDAVVMLAAAVNPVTEPFLIDRVSALAVSRGTEMIICINKSDMDAGNSLREIYEKTPFTLINTSALDGEGVPELMEAMRDKTCVLTGNSGVGKSSLLNAASPELSIKTGEVSDKLGRGRHTTRHTELFFLKNGARVVDTPGFSAFDTQIEPWRKDEVQYAFPEFLDKIPFCRYTGCTHTSEPGCAVLEALANGEVHPERHASYVRLFREAEQIKEWEVRSEK